MYSYDIYTDKNGSYQQQYALLHNVKLYNKTYVYNRTQ